MKWFRQIWWQLIGHRLYWRRLKKTSEWKRAVNTGQFNELIKVAFPESRIKELADRPFTRFINDKRPL